MLLLKHCVIPPYANEFEIHPFCYSGTLIDFCHDKAIRVIAYGSLGASSCGYWEHPLLKKLAESHKASISQLLLSWAVQKKIYVIPKSSTPTRISENFQLVEADLSEMDAMMKEKFKRVYDPVQFFGVDVFHDNK